MQKFTLMELLVVVAIIGILMSILMPSLQKAREVSYSAVCKNNQKNLVYGSTLFSMDNEDKLFNAWLNSLHNWSIPNINGWDGILANQLETPANLFLCPSNKNSVQRGTGGGILSEVSGSFKMNSSNHLAAGNSLKVAILPNMSETILFFDGSSIVSNWHHAATWEGNSNGTVSPLNGVHIDMRHNKKFNISFFDGHVISSDFTSTWQSLGSDDGNTVTNWQGIFD